MVLNKDDVKGLLAMSKGILTDSCHNQRGVVLLVSSGWRLGILLNILQCTGYPTTNKSSLKCH